MTSKEFDRFRRFWKTTGEWMEQYENEKERKEGERNKVIERKEKQR